MVQKSVGQLFLFDGKETCSLKVTLLKTDGCRLRPQPAGCLQEEEEKGKEEAAERGYATNGQKEEKVSLCRGHHQKQAGV